MEIAPIRNPEMGVAHTVRHGLAFLHAGAFDRNYCHFTILPPRGLKKGSIDGWEILIWIIDWYCYLTRFGKKNIFYNIQQFSAYFEIPNTPGVRWIQLNNYETDFLQNFQSNKTVCLIIQAFRQVYKHEIDLFWFVELAEQFQVHNSYKTRE